MFDESASSARSVEADMSSTASLMRDSQGAPPSSGVTSRKRGARRIRRACRREVHQGQVELLDVDADAAAAWQSRAPCDLIRAAEVQQSRRAIFDHIERRRDDVAFDAAA